MTKLRTTFAVAASAILLYTAPVASKAYVPELLPGAHYHAVIKLPFLGGWTKNSTIKQALEQHGFTDVSVTGSGTTRVASGTWMGPNSMDAKAQLDQIESEYGVTVTVRAG
jgi:hypothetical protein